VNGNGTRATARILGIAKDTVTDTLRSIETLLWYVNEDYRARHKNDGITVEFVSVTEAEMDEMGSFVGDTSHQCWLWWAIDHTTGEPLAFHFGTGGTWIPFYRYSVHLRFPAVQKLSTPHTRAVCCFVNTPVPSVRFQAIFWHLHDLGQSVAPLHSRRWPGRSPLCLYTHCPGCYTRRQDWG
jgi:hypothetical protein